MKYAFGLNGVLTRGIVLNIYYTTGQVSRTPLCRITRILRRTVLWTSTALIVEAEKIYFSVIGFQRGKFCVNDLYDAPFYKFLR